MEQTLPRKLVQQRWSVNERRQQLAALNKLRADLSRQIAALDRAGDALAVQRREHLQESIRQVEAQIEEARAAVEGGLRVLKRLEREETPSPVKRRGRRKR